METEVKKYSMTLEEYTQAIFCRDMFVSYETVTELIHRTIEEGGDINKVSKYGETLLSLLLKYSGERTKGSCQEFQQLLDNGVDVDRKMSNGDTILITAYSVPTRPDSTKTRSFAYRLFTHLKKQGRSIKEYVMQRNHKTFQTVLHMAAVNASKDAFENLMYALKKFLSESEFQEVLNQKVEVRLESGECLSLQDAELSPQYGDKNYIIKEYGKNALHLAMSVGNTPAALLLYKAGLGFDSTDAYGRTPLLVAVESAYVNSICAVLEELEGNLDQDYSFINKRDIFGRDLMYLLYTKHQAYYRQFNNNMGILSGIKGLCKFLKVKGEYDLAKLEERYDRENLDKRTVQYEGEYKSIRETYLDKIQYLLRCSCRDHNVHCGGIALTCGADPDAHMDFAGLWMSCWKVLIYRRPIESPASIRDTIDFLMRCIEVIKRKDPTRFLPKDNHPDMETIKRLASGTLLRKLKEEY